MQIQFLVNIICIVSKLLSVNYTYIYILQYPNKIDLRIMYMELHCAYLMVSPNNNIVDFILININTLIFLFYVFFSSRVHKLIKT